MALQVNLTLSKTYFLPGEVVQVSVQICNDADSASPDTQSGAAQVPQVIHIKELSFLACGSERTDPSFIHRLHRPEVPVDVSDSRKQVRSIFTTEPAVLVSDKVLAPHAMQHFQLRFRLPAVLPPSFRGSAVRFLYLIQVKAVYEVHRGGLEAVMYETTASTSLIVWPGSGVGAASAGGPNSTGPDRRTSSLEVTTGGSVAAAAAAASALHRDSSYSSTNAGPDSGAVGSGPTGAGGDSYWRTKGAGSAPSTSPSASQTPHSASFTSPANAGGMPNGVAGAGPAGGQPGARADDDSDIAVCDYGLGRKCRIRWKEVRGSEAGLDDGGGSGVYGDSPRHSEAAEGGGSSGVWASSQAPGLSGASVHSQRGLIPFGINRPYTPPFSRNAAHTMEPDLDSDQDDGQDGGPGDVGGAAEGSRPRSSFGGASASTPQAAHVQRQMSSGAAGGAAGSLSAFGRQASRRGSLFGKVYALNAGEHPLLRLLLQAPLEVPLQPGATFGGVLDFRAPLHAASAASGQPGGGAGPVACYDVVVLLESEELVSPDCRLQGKRDGSGIPAGSPYVIRRLHGEHHELTSDRALTSFTFSLPATATPSFRTPMVSLRWVLRFELTVGQRINFAAVDKRMRSPRPQLEQLVWSLPLVVRPPVAMPR